MLAIFALTVGLIVWAVVSVVSGDDDDNRANGNKDGRKPPATITPSAGPSDPPAVTERPGGTGGSGEPGEEDGGGSGGGSGDGSGSGDGTTSGSDAGSGGAGGDSAAGGPGGAGANQPAGASVPDCDPSRVTVTVRSIRNSYEPGEKPRFRVVVSNSGSTGCKVDFGQDATVITITEASSDQRFWSSGDCPRSRESDLILVPGHGTATRAFTWNLKASAPGCATPRGGPAKAGPGTYLVEAKVPGLKPARVSSFRIESS